MWKIFSGDCKIFKGYGLLVGSGCLMLDGEFDIRYLGNGLGFIFVKKIIL